MKIQMTAKATDDNGNKAIKTIEKEALISDIAEHGERKDFRIFLRTNKRRRYWLLGAAGTR